MKQFNAEVKVWAHLEATAGPRGTMVPRGCLDGDGGAGADIGQRAVWGLRRGAGNGREHGCEEFKAF